MSAWQNKDIFKQSLLKHCIGMLSICISSIKQSRNKKDKFWIILTSFICFLPIWFNRRFLDHNQLDVMIQYILGIYKKIGVVVARMIDLFIDIEEIANSSSTYATDQDPKVLHQELLSKVTLLECLVFLRRRNEHDRISRIIEDISSKLDALTTEAKTITDFGQAVRIYKKIGLTYIKLGKKDIGKDFLNTGLNLARREKIESQIVQIEKILEDLDKDTAK